jgi:stearoyl-CoA desaturase (delta-9 desaturase)
LSSALPYVALAVATLALGFLVAQLAMFATTVYLHRYLAHGSIELRPEVRAASRVVIWITTALKPRQWARVHRYHHLAEDTPDDPHTPRNFGGGRPGAWQVFWRNGPLYTQSTRDDRLASKYRDLTADRWDRWLFDRGEMGLAIGVAVACLTMAIVGHLIIGGWIGVAAGVAGGLAASGLHAAYYLLAGGAINGFGHANATQQTFGGYATNMRVIAWLTVGEGWHRNHHCSENSPRFGYGTQVDLGWIVICVLRGLRLARLTTRGEAGLHRLQALHSDGF